MDRDFYCMHSTLCKTLANEKRQMILGTLRDGELTVGELVERTGIAQANLSQHLATMRSAGAVRSRREGSHIYYALANPKLIQAFDLITEVMQESMEERARTASSTDSAGTAGHEVPANNEGTSLTRRKK